MLVVVFLKVLLVLLVFLVVVGMGVKGWGGGGGDGGGSNGDGVGGGVIFLLCCCCFLQSPLFAEFVLFTLPLQPHPLSKAQFTLLPSIVSPLIRSLLISMYCSSTKVLSNETLFTYNSSTITIS